MAKHRKNNYEDYSADKESPFVLNGQITETVSAKINELQEQLSKRLEKASSEFSPDGDFSIYTGYSGISFFFLQKFRLTGDSRFLTEATKLADSAVSKLKKKRISFLNGDAGPLALAAVLHKLNNEEKISDQLISRLLKADFENPSYPDEILYGRAGYLYSLLFVDKFYSNAIPDEHYRKVMQSILASGKNLAKQVRSSSPLYYMWHDKNYLGAAHGVAGILYLLLAKRELLTEDEKLKLVKPTLEWLVKEKYSSGNPKSSEGSTTDRLVQWCHGAPGFIHLYLKAYEVFAEDKYLALARDLGDIVWERGLLEKGYSICHGVTGNAYTFLALYKVTKEEKYLHRTICFAEYCTNWPDLQGYQPDRPLSLFEGIAGIAYFLNDISDPMNSSFPAYEV